MAATTPASSQGPNAELLAEDFLINALPVR
jgi:hypothetical protein